MTRADGAELLAGNGMADQHWCADADRVEDREYVIGETIRQVAPRGTAGVAEATPRNAVDVVFGGELGRECVEDVSGVPGAGEQYYWPSGTAPIEHLEPNVLLDVDEALCVL